MANRDIITLPVGTAVYPHLHAPDTKFNPNGVYKTDVRYSGEAAEKVREVLDPLADEAYELALENYVEKSLKKLNGRPTKKARQKFASEAEEVVVRHAGYAFELDEDGEETNNIIVGFKATASGKRDDGTTWRRSIPVYDAKGQPVPEGLKVGGGSKIRVAFAPGDNFEMTQGDSVLAGVPRYLEAVQVIELESWGERDAGSFGFEESEGFSADEADDSVFATADEGDEEADDELPWDDDDDLEAQADF